MKKWWLLGIGTLLVAAAVIIYFKVGNKDEAAAAAPAVATTQVRRGTIEVTVSGTGSITPAAKETVSGKQGTVGKVMVKEGDKVKEGDVLATLEGDDNADKIKSEQLSLEKKQLQLESLQEQYKSETDEKALDNLKLSMKQQQLDIEQSESTIADLQDASVGDTITAPVGGTVTSVSVADGDTLGNNSDLFEIADYDHLQIVVGIDELDISKVKLNQTAAISVEALSDKSYTGKVVKIADEGTSSNGVASFDVTIAIDNPDGLKSGMSAEATIQVDKKENTLMLPIDAVQSLGNRYMVFLPEGSDAAKTAQANMQNGWRANRGGGQQAANGQGQAQGQDAQGAGASGGRQAGQAQGAAGVQGSQGAAGTQGSQGAASGQGAERGGAQAGDNQGAAQGQGGARQFGQRSGGAASGNGNSNGNSNGGSGFGSNRQGSSRLTSRFGGGVPQMIQVGIHNEDYIEVLSGLTEGEEVILPTVTVTSSTNQQQQNARGFGFGGSGFGGGGFGGGAGFAGGGGQRRSSTSGGGARTGGSGGGQ